MKITSAKKILIIRLRFIGDIVLTTPFIANLRKNYPDSHIAYLFEEGYGQVLSGNPLLNELIQIPRNANLFQMLKVINTLRDKKFDAVIDLFGNPRSAILAYLTNAKYRVGFNFPVRRNFYNIVVKDSGSRNTAIDVYLNVLNAIDANLDTNCCNTTIYLSDEEKKNAKDFLAESKIDINKKIIGINPGATWQAKRWLKEKFALLADILVDKYNSEIIIFEGPKEKGIANEISNLMKKKIVCVNNLDIKYLSSVIERCNLFITNDAGPMHISVALNVPTIAIFGPGEPDIWFPYDKSKHIAFKKQVSCWPCNLDVCEKQDCMKAISVDDVLLAVEKMLKGK
ncbi:MAG: lipopolysaccharide heptosyltransferase II [Candidatus Firestonebacteria bacterium]